MVMAGQLGGCLQAAQQYLSASLGRLSQQRLTNRAEHNRRGNPCRLRGEQRHNLIRHCCQVLGVQIADGHHEANGGIRRRGQVTNAIVRATAEHNAQQGQCNVLEQPCSCGQVATCCRHGVHEGIAQRLQAVNA